MVAQVLKQIQIKTLATGTFLHNFFKSYDWISVIYRNIHNVKYSAGWAKDAPINNELKIISQVENLYVLSSQRTFLPVKVLS